MNDKLAWYVSRSSGWVAFVLLACTVLWGILGVTRLIERKGLPRWLLDLHRHLAFLTVLFTAIHLGGLVGDNFMQIGWREIMIPFESLDHVPNNPFFAANASDIARIEAYMDELRKAGDSCGARINVVARGVPVGLGEPLFDKLDADIAYAMMGINAVKGVEIGAGFASVAQRGTTHGDELTPQGFASNNAGGVLGGISTGQDITVSIAIKPTSSIRSPRRSIDLAGQPATVETFGRHDPCVGIRATPIAEAMLALVLMDHALRHRAQCGDVRSALAAIPGHIG